MRAKGRVIKETLREEAEWNLVRGGRHSLRTKEQREGQGKEVSFGLPALGAAVKT